MNHLLSHQYAAIKQAISIVDVIGQFVSLKKSGGSYTGKCPFHDDRNPSFSVAPGKGVYHCFGCDASGDTIAFIQEHEQTDFKGAMRWLAAYYHLPLDDSSSSYTPAPIAQETATTAAPAPVPVTKRTEPYTAREWEHISPGSFTMQDYMEGSMRDFKDNNLIRFLHTLFDDPLVARLAHTYWLGTSSYYPGGTILWQVDEGNNVRGGKIMPFDPVTGKRNRQAFPPMNWVHSVLHLEDFELKQCFYGQHLLAQYPHRPVAIVESEKTAIIASIYLPAFTWLASGGKANLTLEKCKCLAGFNVTLFPDLDGYEAWEKLAAELSVYVHINVSSLLQDAAVHHNLSEKSDLCDYLAGPFFRRDMMDNFKQALLSNPDQSDAGQWEVWKRFRETGMRAADRVTACKELISEGLMDGPEVQTS